jgi:hypothetical protein
MRRISVAIVFPLAMVLVLLASVGVWAQRQVVNEKVFASNVQQILEKPQVTKAFASAVAEETMKVLTNNLQTFSQVPQPIAPTISLLLGVLEGIVTKAVDRELQSTVLRGMLVEVVTDAQSQLKIILEDEPKLNDKKHEVVLNYLPIISEVIRSLQASGVIPVSIPLPESTIGVSIIDSETHAEPLKEARRYYTLVNQILMALVVMSLLLLLALVALGINRRSGLQLAMMSVSLSMVAVLGVSFLMRRLLPSLVNGTTEQAALEASVPVFTKSLETFGVVSLIGASTLFVLLWAPWKRLG